MSTPARQLTSDFAYPVPALLIDGEHVRGGGRRVHHVIDPATEAVLGELPLATAADLDRALAAAQASWPAWRGMMPQARGRILKRAADLIRERLETIARIATMEEGKPLAETRIECAISADIFEWYAEEGRRAYGRVIPQRAPGVRLQVVKEPVGPVAAFAPWNFPLGNPARKLGAALAARLLGDPEAGRGVGVLGPRHRPGAAGRRAAAWGDVDRVRRAARKCRRTSSPRP